MKRSMTYPHADVRVKGEPPVTRNRSPILPLHRPLVMIMAERGQPNVPVWGDVNDLYDEFGEATFDKFGKWFTNAHLFLTDAILPNQAAMVVRLVAPDAKVASTVIECHLTKDYLVTQYKRAADGSIMLDGNGSPMPVLDGANNIVKEPGVQLKYVARQLKANEKAGYVQRSTIQAGGKTVEIIPITDLEATSPGRYGDRTGLKLYFDPTAQDQDLIDTIGAIGFTMAPVQQLTDSNLATPIRNIYGNAQAEFVFKPNQIDKRTARRISVSDILDNNYTSPSTKTDLLPYNANFYAENIKYIGDAVRAVETNNPELSDGWMVDVFSALDLKGHPYQHVELDTISSGAVTLNENYVLYLEGGDDGDTSWEMYQTLIQQYLSLQTYPPLRDSPRYPYTHIYDVGYNLETKYAIIKHMGVRDDFKAILCTQDISMDANSMEEDMAALTAIRARCLLQPESLFHGTSCCRAEIFQQCGLLNDTSWKTLVPPTFWSAKVRSQMMNTTFVRDIVKGHPATVLDMYRWYNWTHYDPEMKQLSWDNAGNYFEHADMVDIFYADVRSVYQYDTSVLSDSSFTDCVVFLKYISRRAWASQTGSTAPIQTVFQNLEKEVEAEAYKAFGGFFPVAATAYQTAEEAIEGDIIHVQAAMTGPIPKRRFITDIVCQRESTATATNS